MFDDLGVPVALEPPATRIVSLVPSLTELLFSLGVGKNVVGITRYCTEPAAVVDRLPRVGGTKNPNLAAIRALAPDLVVANAEENRAADVEKLRHAGLRVFVSYPRRVRELPGLMRRLGQLTAAHAAAEQLAAELEERMARIHLGGHCRVFVPIWRNPWMSVGADTFAADLLALCGGQNVCASAPGRYPEVALEQVRDADPEVILLPDEPYRFERKHLPSLQPLAATRAWRRGAVYFIDGKALTWFGPRTAGAIRYLQGLLQAC